MNYKFFSKHYLEIITDIDVKLIREITLNYPVELDGNTLKS